MLKEKIKQSSKCIEISLHERSNNKYATKLEYVKREIT